MPVRSKRLVPVGAAVLAVLAVLAAGLVVAAIRAGDDGPATPPAGGVTRTRLGQADPANAPGQSLYLEQVTIAPGAKLAEHFHEGTQVARVVSGVLTYNIVSGTAAVTRADGRTEEVTGPTAVRLAAGETVTETAGLVHYGANDSGSPVVIELAALLERGAPLATTTGSGAAGAVLHLTATLESQARTLHTAGVDGTIVYGWNRLTATTALDGTPVAVEMLGSVSYSAGSGPFSGFITFSFADGSTLGVTMVGAARASADTADATFAATLGVVGGTGRYLDATGTGTFVGSRTPVLGSSVAATFDLRLEGTK